MSSSSPSPCIWFRKSVLNLSPSFSCKAYSSWFNNDRMLPTLTVSKDCTSRPNLVKFPRRKLATACSQVSLKSFTSSPAPSKVVSCLGSSRLMAFSSALFSYFYHLFFSDLLSFRDLSTALSPFSSLSPLPPLSPRCSLLSRWSRWPRLFPPLL